MEKLLTRAAFRNAVFNRDGHKCIFCDVKENLDAHHIIDRRLWVDQGYYLSNGATVCQMHHILCEETTISCKEVREKAGIVKFVIPDHLYDDTEYDKWANPILQNGLRLRGELFFDESVQKVLAQGNNLAKFSHHIKYPRTHHLPWSPGVSNDDRVMHDLSGLQVDDVVIAAKLDGENTSMYFDKIHARSLEYRPRIDRDWIKALHSRIAYEIPEEWRICGENVWAEHSIVYKNLSSAFYMFSIWNEKNECLSWDDTTEWAKLFNLETVPILYRGPWNEKLIKNLYKPQINEEDCEGYVVRDANSFKYSEFRKKVAKYVRENHVSTQAHWTRKIVSNGFEKDALKRGGL